MGVFSEMDWDLRNQEDNCEQDGVSPFTLNENAAAAPSPTAVKETFDDDARQQAEADTAQAALSILNGEKPPSETEADAGAETPDVSEDQKRIEHETKEAQRKAEWDAKQAAKKAVEDQAMQEMLALSDDAVMDASVKRLGLDAERLTRRNMKMCVTEHIQTLCLDNPEFARKAMHPRKSMMNCFKYINRHAFEFIKQEMEDNDEKPAGNYAMGDDVPDDLCYQWAEDYFNDPDAKEDHEKEETFVPKPYYGKSSSKKKKEPAKKEPAKKKETQKPTEQPAPAEQMQLMMGA